MSFLETRRDFLRYDFVSVDKRGRRSPFGYRKNHKAAVKRYRELLDLFNRNGWTLIVEVVRVTEQYQDVTDTFNLFLEDN